MGTEQSETPAGEANPASGGPGKKADGVELMGTEQSETPVGEANPASSGPGKNAYPAELMKAGFGKAVEFLRVPLLPWITLIVGAAVGAECWWGPFHVTVSAALNIGLLGLLWAFALPKEGRKADQEMKNVTPWWARAIGVVVVLGSTGIVFSLLGWYLILHSVQLNELIAVLVLSLLWCLLCISAGIISRRQR